MQTHINDDMESTVEQRLATIIGADFAPDWLRGPMLRSLKRVDPELDGSHYLGGMNIKTSTGSSDIEGGLYVKFDRLRTVNLGTMGLIDYGLRRLGKDQPFMEGFRNAGQAASVNGEFDRDGLYNAIIGNTTDAVKGEKVHITMDAAFWIGWLEELFNDGRHVGVFMLNIDGELMMVGAVEHDNTQLSLMLNLTKLRLLNSEIVETQSSLH